MLAGIMIGAHRIRADKTGLMGFGAKNGTHGIESSKTVRVGFGLRKTGLTGFTPKKQDPQVVDVVAIDVGD